jgi:ABC-2 type transport system permease protein
MRLPSGTSRRGILSVLSSPVAALVAKDLKYVVRDSVLLGQLGMPVILFLVPFALAMQPGLRSVASRSELYWVAIAMTSLVVFMQTSILSLSSIGIENRGFWMVLTSPNPARAMVAAKFIMSTLVSSVVGIALLLVDGMVFQAEPAAVLLQCVVVTLAAAALCGMGVGISAALPRFVYENPAHRVSIWALILGFLGSIGYLMISVTVIAAAVLFAEQLTEQAGFLYGVGAVLFVGISWLAAFIPMEIGAKRLETYQWEQ